MNKKVKIMYFTLFVITLLLSIIDLALGLWRDSVFMFLMACWIVICYFQARSYIYYKDKFREAERREKIRQQEFNKMRERAQNAEKQLQQILDDTPARGEDGRFVKREVE